MRKPMRTKAMLALTGLLASLLALVPAGTAQAAESVPDLRWPAISASDYGTTAVTGPAGSMTMPCISWTTGGDLTTYGTTGQVVRQLDSTGTIDGVQNCIYTSVVDKNGVLYGIPYGELSGGGWGSGPNLLAYDGNTLKWKYPARCENGGDTDYVVGADGNIYVETRLSNGDVRLIGLASELEAGQTEPTVVMDVDIPNDCSSMLYPYKDGIMVHGQSYGHARFYSYSGKFLGQATIGDVWYEKVNADGQLFVPKWVHGDNTTLDVAVYDPRKGHQVWRTYASTPGADVQTARLYPMPGGGVLAFIKEQKVSGGIPTTPIEYVYTLVVLNEGGQKVRSVTLPNEDAQGNLYGNTYATVDEHGNVGVVRDMSVPTSVSSPSTVPGISIGVYDPLSDTWTYQESMTGDLDKQGGPSGYRVTGWEQDAVMMADNTLFLLANCTDNCNDYSRKLYAVEVSGLGMDYPRAEVLNANTGTQPEPQSYVALGDSFSSGAGLNPYVDETACLRSTQAYSRVNGLDPYTSLQLDQFVACSGAKTEHVLGEWVDQNHSEPAQVDALSGSPAVVTITIGGNDVLFADFAEACVLESCDADSQAYADSKSAIDNDLSSALQDTYMEILEETTTSGAQIYVLGYPHVIADKSGSALSDPRCPYMYNVHPDDSDTTGYPWADAWASRDIVERLNSKIETTVNAVRALDPDNERLHFVSATENDSPFNGHEICGTGDSYFYNADQVPDMASVFHPNDKGQAAYAELVRDAIGE